MMRTRLLSPRSVHTRHSGFTLVEVLVALVVLSIGLLGIGKLMLFASRSNDSAYLRSQATELAYQMVDDMRANRLVALSGSYTTALATAGTTSLGYTCAGTVCSQTNLAGYDVNTWKLRLASQLPSGKGSVVIATAGTPPMTTATITVQWDDSAAQSSFGASAYGVTSNVSVTLETVL